MQIQAQHNLTKQTDKRNIHDKNRNSNNRIR